MTSLTRLRLALPRADFPLRVDLTLPMRGTTVLFGPSGCGKTSLLRSVAGLERPQEALIQFGETCWQDDARGVFVPTWQRSLGYVFQEASLFDHLSVQANLDYGLRRRGLSDRQALNEAIALLGIGHLLTRHPAQLSGGERQRVAIARALATRPRVLLMDEPLASLDQTRRREILPWIERLRDELTTPLFYVTHAADEVARLADHLVVLEQGQVRASGPVGEVLAAVETPVVIGEDAGVLVQAALQERDARWHLARAAFPGGTLWVRDPGWPLGRSVRLRILARDVSLASTPPGPTSIQNVLPGFVEACGDDQHPSQMLVRVRCGGVRLLARITRRAWDQLGLSIGQPAWVQVKSAAIIE